MEAEEFNYYFEHGEFMPLAPQEARKVREDTTIERPARKISMTDGYAEEKKEEPETQSETTGGDKPAEPSGEESKEKYIKPHGRGSFYRTRVFCIPTGYFTDNINS